MDWRGDGYCDDENNTEECGFDGGDCCDNDRPNWNHFCQECDCLEPRCQAPNWKGDGYCDDENNTEECGFDGGDCCSEKLKEAQAALCIPRQAAAQEFRVGARILMEVAAWEWR